MSWLYVFEQHQTQFTENEPEQEAAAPVYQSRTLTILVNLFLVSCIIEGNFVSVRCDSQTKKE